MIKDGDKCPKHGAVIKNGFCQDCVASDLLD